MRNRNRARAFTFVEIVIVGFLLSLGTAALMGVRTGMSETSRRVYCASNLRQMGQAILLYSNENAGYYPRTRHDPAVEKWPTYTNYKAKDPFADDGPEVNDVSAAIFLLLRTQDITSEVLICQSSDDARFDYDGSAQGSQDFSNFPRKSTLSYSYANPYSKEQDNPLTNNISAEFAIAADMNPGADVLTKLNSTATAEEMRVGNSRNHKSEGQNVLFGDGHVEWNTNSFVGVQHDNIYTYGESGEARGGDGIIGASIGPTDSVLLPTATEDAK